MDCSPCIQAAALYTQAAAPRLQASREYTAMMGDVHGHNNDGSVDIEMASYKSQMGVRALVAIVSIAGDGGALQRRSRVTAALTSTATTHHSHRHHRFATTPATTGTTGITATITTTALALAALATPPP